jgi:hypothetical protein
MNMSRRKADPPAMSQNLLADGAVRTAFYGDARGEKERMLRQTNRPPTSIGGRHAITI